MVLEPIRVQISGQLLLQRMVHCVPLSVSTKFYCMSKLSGGTWPVDLFFCLLFVYTIVKKA